MACSDLLLTRFSPCPIPEQYGASRILLATDSAEAAALCARGVLGFECATMPLERGKFESADLIEHRVAAAERAGGAQTDPLSGSRVALDALADIDMLADCDLFVLVLRSCFGRVAYALNAARRGTFAPLVSLEQAWSSSGAGKLGKGGLRGDTGPKGGTMMMRSGRKLRGRGRGRGRGRKVRLKEF